MEYIPAKNIVIRTKNTSWFGTDYNMNIYKGCCHGCIYCDSRSECYGVEDFGRVRAKERALEIIRDDLRRKVKKGIIGTGSMSDPYNPFEQKLLLSRHALELINAFDFGVSIATKSHLVTRDVDILSDIRQHSPVLVKMTITTMDEKLCSILEPHVASTKERFQAIRTLAEQGIFCGVLLMPILPFINDSEENVGGILQQAKESGARFVYPAFGVTLRDIQREYFYEQLDAHFPNLKEKYMKRYGNRYSCGSPKAKTLYSFFVKECERLGLLYQMKDIVYHYKQNSNGNQLSLFDAFHF